MSTTPDELLVLASKSRREMRLADARQEAEDAARLYRSAGAQTGVARAVAMIGQIARDQCQLADAIPHYMEWVAIRRAEGDLLPLAHAVRHLADLYREIDGLESAAACYEEALTLYRQNERTSPLDLANTLRGLALLRDMREGSEEARPLWEEAKDIYAAMGIADGVSECSARLDRRSR